MQVLRHPAIVAGCLPIFYLSHSDTLDDEAAAQQSQLDEVERWTHHQFLTKANSIRDPSSLLEYWGNVKLVNPSIPPPF